MQARRHLTAAALLAALALLAGGARAQAPAPSPAPGKIALTSLAGDTMTVTVYRERVGTSMQSNPVTVLKVPGPILDHAVLKAAQTALERAQPKLQVAMLRVPAAGSSGDPSQLVVDGKLAAGHPLLEALRQQGFTHLVAATRLRARNAVKLADGDVVGTGQLEGLGFYIDNTIQVAKVQSGERAQGIIAPHVYLQLTLIDLAAMEVRGTQAIAASTVAAASDNPAGLDPWGAMTPEQKLRAITRLIDDQVGPAVTRLVPAAQ